MGWLTWAARPRGPGGYGEERSQKGGSAVKNLPAMQEIQVPPLRPKDPLEEEMATHASILVSKSPWTQELGGLQTMDGVTELDTTGATEYAQK